MRNHTPIDLSAGIQALSLCLFVLLAGCGALQGPQDPDEVLPVTTLNPQGLVLTEHTAVHPDSSGPTATDRLLRFPLSAGAQTALQAGAALEFVMRVPAGTVSIQGWDEGSGTWTPLLLKNTGGSGMTDVWWRDAWADRAAGEALLASDGFVRLRVDPAPADTLALLRIISPEPGMQVIARTHTTITAASSQLAVQAGTSLSLLDPGGTLVGTVTSSGAPPAMARLAGWYHGGTDTEMRRMPSTGGSWVSEGLFPDWGGHNGIATAAGASDLFVIRYGSPGSGQEFATFYRLSDESLLQFSDFSSAADEGTPLRRNGLPGGTGSGFAWWSAERVLVIPGTNDGAYGLVTFSLAGRFLDFIPLPFDEASEVQIAFVGSYLFVGHARPTLASLAWTASYQPVPPIGDFIYRWTSP